MNNQSSILVSIIIPVFNVERYLRECLDSVVNQTLREIEIICVNDGSEDSSLAILHEYAKKDERIKVIDKPDEGQAIARNLALSLISGEYVVFVDSDDHVDLDLCRKVYSFAKEHQCDLVMYDFIRIRDVSEIQQKSKGQSSLSDVDPLDRKTLLKQMGVVWTKCVRTDFIRLNKIRFPEGRIYEDIFVHWQLVLLARTPGVLPQKLYHYRIQLSATTYRTDWKITDRFFIFDMIREFLISQNLYETYRDVFLQEQLEVFCWLYDTINISYKDEAMKLIHDRLNVEHWAYIDAHKPLAWKTRDFYREIRGSRLAKIRHILWFFIRDFYRSMNKLVHRLF
jgi:glycosyltransferase involved in cell wall biosynthesis